MKKLGKNSSDDDKTALQFAALPYRTLKDGTVEVLLITSRGVGRWLIPKGWPIKGKKPHEAAATEAYEEAGVVGDANKRRIGTYAYRKRLNSGSSIRCRVEVFAMEVESLKDDWPERSQRTRKWFSAKKAAAIISDRQLGSVIRAVSAKA